MLYPYFWFSSVYSDKLSDVSFDESEERDQWMFLHGLS